MKRAEPDEILICDLCDQPYPESDGRLVEGPHAGTARLVCPKCYRDGPPKRSSEYNRGYEDATLGTPPDYSQATAEQFQDYRAGYRDGLRDKAQEREDQ